MPRMPSGLSRTRATLVFAGLVLALGSVRHYRDDIHPANESARVYAAMAIVDHGTVALDPVFDQVAPGWRNTGRPPNRDVAVRGERHLLDKAPGLTLAAVPVVATLRALGLHPGFADLTWLLSLLLCALPTALFGAFLAGRLRRDPATAAAPGWVAPALIVATPWLAYGGMFFGHAPAAALIGFGALLALGPLGADREHPEQGGPQAGPAGRSTPRDSLLAGLALGGAVLVELPAIALAAGVTVAVAADRRVRRHLPWLLAGALVPAAILLAWNVANFGHPLAMSYGFKHDAAFATYHAQGLYGVSWPTAERLWGLLVGARRGLLFLAPWMGIGLVGAGVAAFDRALSRGWRIALAGCGLGFPVLMAGFVDWTAGASMGPRHLLAGLAFPGIAAARALGRWDYGRAAALLRPVLVGLAATSLALCAAGAWVFPYFGSRGANPLFEVALPVLLEAGFAPTLWNAWLPGAWGVLPPSLGLAMALVAATGGARPGDATPPPARLGRPFATVLALAVALAHIGLASLPQATRVQDLRHVLLARAVAFELLGRDDLARAIRDALDRSPTPLR